MTKLSTHFKSEEFACHCCGVSKATPELITLLETIRQYANAPLVINCGYRCAKHNATVGGVNHSQHLLGNAADIQIHGMTPAKAQQFIQELHDSGKCHVGGLGRYATFTHVDARDGTARWSG